MDKTCNIQSVTYTNVGGVQKRTYASLYTGISCDFYAPSKRTLQSLQYAENAHLPKYEVVLPITYSSVSENYVIELIDPVLGNMGKYIIGSVGAFRGGVIDCIVLLCHEMKGQK